MIRSSIGLVSLVCALVFIPSSPLAPGTALGAECECHIREYRAAEEPPCPACDGANYCAGTTTWIQARHICAAAGWGESGKTECEGESAQIATYYNCEEDWKISHFIACGAGAVICGVACGGCLAAPTPVTCLPCIGCLATTLPGCDDECGYVEACVKVNPQDVFRHRFKRLNGDACEGGEA